MEENPCCCSYALTWKRKSAIVLSALYLVAATVVLSKWYDHDGDESEHAIIIVMYTINYMRFCWLFIAQSIRQYGVSFYGRMDRIICSTPLKQTFCWCPINMCLSCECCCCMQNINCCHLTDQIVTIVWSCFLFVEIPLFYFSIGNVRKVVFIMAFLPCFFTLLWMIILILPCCRYSVLYGLSHCYGFWCRCSDLTVNKPQQLQKQQQQQPVVVFVPNHSFASPLNEHKNEKKEEKEEKEQSKQHENENAYVPPSPSFHQNPHHHINPHIPQ
jgi:hypothetical protein